MEAPNLLVTTVDHERLDRVLATHIVPRDRNQAEWLEAELMRAQLVNPAEIPNDVVTMNSRVEYEDPDSGARKEVTIVYPHQVDLSTQKISILSPVGAALLGLREGQTTSCELANGTRRTLRVTKVVYQPEANGDFHL